MLATTVQLVRFVLLLSITSLAIANASAAPKIEIDFETDAARDGEIVRARTVFHARAGVVHGIFSRFADYPAMHDWIRETELLKSSGDTRELMIRFEFPWPVGSQWSRIEVRTDCDVITWKQLEGSLVANSGSLRFEIGETRVGIDYSATINVGMPDLWTRAYRKKFVTEFLTAVHRRAADTGQSRIALASPELR